MGLKGRGFRRSILTALGAGDLYETIDSQKSRDTNSISEKLQHFEGLRSADRLIELDFPIKPRVRYGWDNPPNAELFRRISSGDARYADLIRKFLPYISDISKITKHATTPDQPHWINDWFPAFDAMTLYSLLAIRKPSRLIEIGSGTTTKFARRSIRDQDLSTKIISIDPFPRSEIDEICDEVIRLQLENVPLSFFEAVTPNDLIFFDGSHRSFQNSDATVFFTEILPILPAGTMIGVHDIFLPHDYPADWLGRYYSEQYLLACWILAGDTLNIELPVFHCTKTPELHAILNELWDKPELANSNLSGGILWFTIRKR